MFTGKGGVGKTTLSAATALFFSRNQRTLLVSTDPSGSLQEIFGVKFDEGVKHIKDNLDVVELTREMILKLWREKFGDEVYAVVSSFFPVKEEIINYIEGAPGIDMEFMLDYVLTALKSKKYDLIIWDTAPTASILNLLQVQYMFYSHLTQAQKIYLTIKRLIRQVDPLALIEKWKELTAEIINMLKKDTSAWIVTTPERLPVEQALFLAQALEKFGITVNGFILNKLLDKNICQECVFLEKKREQQRKWMEHLFQQSKLPVKIIPELVGDLTDENLLYEIAEKIYS
jgi:arsenite-transporting ATPase